MKHSYYNVCLLLLFLMNSIFSVANIQLPKKAMGKPTIFKNESESYRWEDIAEQRQWGSLSNDFWRVYVDRNGVVAHEEPNSHSKSLRTLNFMDGKDILFVAKIENGYALLYTEREMQINLTISSKAKAVGWVSVDELLLWSHCLRMQNQVYRKAVILKDVDEYQNNSQLEDEDFTSPRFSESPNRMLPSGYRAKNMEFYFVYKVVNGSALLLPDNKIEGNVGTSKKGWIFRSLYTAWNERVCYEPNFGKEVSDCRVGVFKEIQDAISFRNGQTVQTTHEWWSSVCPSERWSSKKTRFPVLDSYENGISLVGTIGMLSNKKQTPEKPIDIDVYKDKLDKLIRQMKRINVVFVIDGTSSMKDYYKPVANALVNYMKLISAKEANIYFGAVVYRNYADEAKKRLVEDYPLTKGGTGLANWLVSRQCWSVGETHYEAMYYGLNHALDKMSWNSENCNFIILVGDAANEVKDQRGFTEKSIASKMHKKGVYLVAFQANHPNNPAYHKFEEQVQNIINAVWYYSSGKEMKREYNKLVDNTYLFKYRNEDLFPIFVSGLRLAEIDQSEDANKLQALIQERIEFFKNTADENIGIINKVIDGGDDTEKLEPGVIKYLISRGFTQQDIKNLMGAGVLKIKGYTSLVSNNKNVFISSVFFTKTELEELIKSLRSVSKDVSQNQRKELQDALKKLALTYIGQGKDYSNMSVLEIIQAVSGLPSIIGGTSPLKDIDLNGITNPNKVTQREINDIINRMSKAAQRLENRKVDNKCYYDSPNGLRYYYILMEDMPLQGD